jgi:hypothetical protein
LDTSAFAAGDTLWLSETAGAMQANTPPSEPAHAVFIGYVARAHPTLGRIVLAIQNGYELNELHGVSVPTPIANDYFYYNGTTSLWENRQLTASVISDSTTVGINLVTLPNPSAIRYLRVNADNSVTAISAATLKTELGGKQLAFKTADQSSNSLAFADLTNLSFAVVAGVTYRFKIFCQFDVTNVATGTRWAVNGPAFTRLFYNVIWSSGTGLNSNFAFNTYDATSTTSNTHSVSNNCAIIEGIIVPSANGTLIARFACELTLTSVTCKAGSYIEFEEI